jgi:hypothetical protein
MQETAGAKPVHPAAVRAWLPFPVCISVLVVVIIFVLIFINIVFIITKPAMCTGRHRSLCRPTIRTQLSLRRKDERADGESHGESHEKKQMLKVVPQQTVG